MATRITEIDDLLGKKLKLARISRNMTQHDLASIIGITFQQIQKYEKGLNRISAGRLYQFIRILNVNFDYFFSDAEDIEFANADSSTEDNATNENNTEAEDSGYFSDTESSTGDDNKENS